MQFGVLGHGAPKKVALLIEVNVFSNFLPVFEQLARYEQVIASLATSLAGI
jgi:hypothetical protein